MDDDDEVAVPAEGHTPAAWHEFSAARKVPLDELLAWMYRLRTASSVRYLDERARCKALHYIAFRRSHAAEWRCTGPCGHSTVALEPDGMLLQCGCLMCLPCIAKAVPGAVCAEHKMRLPTADSVDVAHEVAARHADVTAATMVLQAAKAGTLAETVKHLREQTAAVDPTNLGPFQQWLKKNKAAADAITTHATETLKAYREYLTDRCETLLVQSQKAAGSLPPYPPTPKNTMVDPGRALDVRPAAARSPVRARHGGMPSDLKPDVEIDEGCELQRGSTYRGCTVFATGFDGKCKSCYRATVKKRTLMAFIGEGATKKCMCMLCAFQKTSAAVYKAIMAGDDGGSEAAPAASAAPSPRKRARMQLTAAERAEVEAITMNADDAFDL